ncbi:MAG: ATP-binding protein [Blastocatellia bacterium]|nr:ATP-binding protein [Blastocatellia bacterium]
MIGKCKLPIYIILLLAAASATAMADGYLISLEGNHKFSLGDDPSWAAPEFDDSDWRELRVPGSWHDQDIDSVLTRGWYRIRFEVSANIRQPALSLGIINNADEVFLNGVKIGGEGAVSSEYVQAPVERLYLLPENLILYDRVNLLAIRAMSLYSGGGLITGPVKIGDYSGLLREKTGREKKVLTTEAGFMAFFAFSFIYPFFLYSRMLHNREFLYAWLCLFICAVIFFLDSRIFYETGLRSFLLERVLIGLESLLASVFLMFLMQWHKERVYWPVKLLIGFFIAQALAYLVWPDDQIFFIIYNLIFLTYIPLGAVILFVAVRAYLRKLPESGIILLGMGGLVLSVMVEIVGPKSFERVNGILFSYYGIGWLIVCVMYARAARFVRTQDSLQRASEKILAAHEEERKRLARELHDGVGQSLLAIKLNLQMMNAKVQSGTAIKGGWIPELISEITDSTDELRRVAMGLRPSFIEDVEMADALNLYGKYFQEKSAVEVRVQVRGEINSSPKVKDHLFRIFQEALSNIGKHSEASLADVTLKTSGRRLCLEIRDNGKGFDTSAPAQEGTGLGLSTMRERTELMGGICRIKSSPGKGTTIEIEVPLDD